MLKNLLRIPDTFDPDDRRRRQVLNVLLLFGILVALSGILMTLAGLACYHCGPLLSEGRDAGILSRSILALVFCFILLWANRSPRVSSWLSAGVFTTCFIVLCLNADTPAELYNGRSTLVFAIPIMLGAVLFPPGYAFLITLFICIIMLFFTPPDSRYVMSSPVNYYSMLTLFFIASISWLSMSIANRAIHDARRRAEEARRHAANLEAILNGIADGVLVLDLQGGFVSANPALARMIPEEHLRQLGEKLLEETVRWQQKVFSVSASPVPDVGSVVVFRDETRRRETERARDALLAVASHELRTPLAAMLNYMELMLMLAESGKIEVEKFVQHLQRAIENGARLQRLVNDILDQAQIQAGTLELKSQRFDLHDLLEKTRPFLADLIREKQLSYNLSIAPGVPTEIEGDPDRLHQVLVNLLGNAAKFTQHGGIEMNISLGDLQTLSITVADTGLGIPEAQLPDIFEAFRRGSDYAQREQQGAGLGLSIAKEIITRMGGSISVASTIGVGSVFTVLLPLDGFR